MTLRYLSIMALALLAARPVSAAAPGEGTVPSVVDPRAIALYATAPQPVKGTTGPEIWTQMTGQRWVRNVVRPVIIPILTPADKATGASVVLLPGGGFRFVSIDNEGYLIAKRLNEAGINAFVVVYRTMPTPVSHADFLASMNRGTPAQEAEQQAAQRAAAELAVQDAQTAMRYVRTHATDYRLDPHRVGLAGFSAGAITALRLVLADAPGTVPDTIGIIYGNTSLHQWGDGQVPNDAPPMFNALALDDQFFGKEPLDLIEAWRAKGKSVEFHLFEGGGHGYASFPSGRHTSDLWYDEYLAWLKTKGWVSPAR